MDRGNMDAAGDLALALHVADFRSVLIESHLLPQVFQRVVVTDSDLSADRFAKLMEVADRMGARVALHEMRLDQQVASRIMLWPVGTT